MRLRLSPAVRLGPMATSSLAYPSATLALDFATPVYESAGTAYDPLSTVPGYTFTRTGEQGAVDSTGAVSYFAANVPAINDRGYHAYGALTNLVLQSQDLTAAEWSAASATATANAIAAPDGATTADRIVEVAASAAQTRSSTAALTISSGTIYTMSAFFKAGERRYAHMIFGGSAAAHWIAATFDLVGGTVTKSEGGAGSGTVTGAYIVPCASGWYRCVLVGSIAQTAAYPYVGMVDSATPAYNASWGYYVYAGNTANGLYCWQAQLLLGNFSDGGPIIRTAGTTASIGASALAVNLANATYSATYTFDDATTQTNASLTIADGVLNLPADFSPNKNIIKRLIVT